MPCRIIDGKKIAGKFLSETKKSIDDRKIRPKLVTLLSGGDPASLTYVNIKKKTCESVGIRTDIRKIAASEQALLDEIDRLNADPDVSGILVQLPLPAGISTHKIIE